MAFQMAMIKILQFLGKVTRYYDVDGKKTPISLSDAEFEELYKNWKNTDAASRGNFTYEGWYWYDKDAKINYGQAPKWVCEIVAPILNVLNSLLVPVIIILGVAGMVYGIVLGVQYSKAETADKRDELKKRLISAAIGIVIALVILILMKIFVMNAGSIFGWVKTTSDETTSTT